MPTFEDDFEFEDFEVPEITNRDLTAIGVELGRCGLALYYAQYRLSDIQSDDAFFGLLEARKAYADTFDLAGPEVAAAAKNLAQVREFYNGQLRNRHANILDVLASRPANPFRRKQYRHSTVKTKMDQLGNESDAALCAKLRDVFFTTERTMYRSLREENRVEIPTILADRLSADIEAEDTIFWASAVPRRGYQLLKACGYSVPEISSADG